MQGHEDKLYKGMQNPERITGGAVTPISSRSGSVRCGAEGNLKTVTK